ncbi:MAG: GNAT family N-acetyltransferase [Candidatus Marinimicrobia bacterium]|jgi:predicted GNAT superfamily acetyltransferase|nr:GNAT family N-acetyltransferase [Candidatus Neomarinimicrobiota bacterium]MBT3631696.1 GNAT family N-acetyltransferase [Candidatus Neomarinimicrobiota bacterium]MBT3825897.1 GNAT family N-acetyltransferase [Candidatus Neomarinimicrobiota bacterium]MBT4129994.1 GNAT family N-acetyltransferase [Candidatus Neomarinimicrobiota bacterium]MBT4296020.1 GNAT family N-acetyltransferase [Candidatus Neomarinimicrobiota bacterium]
MIFAKSRATEQKLEQIRKQQALLLIAYDGVVPVGFKLGYVIENKQSFFSWLGGVHEDYRRQGIAQALLEKQEQHVRTLGITQIYFTTFNRFPAMINLGKNNHYSLIKTAPEQGEVKYWYEKQLL